MIFYINCMTDLINISIQSDFNFVGNIYVSMIKSRNNHILLTIALLLGQVIKKEVNTTIQVMNILLPMGGMVTHWLMSQQNNLPNTTSLIDSFVPMLQAVYQIQQQTKHLTGPDKPYTRIAAHNGNYQTEQGF